MKQLTTDEIKIKLVEKLHKEKHITFREALSLLEVETRTEYIYQPYYSPVSIPSIFDSNQINEPLFTYTNSGTESYTLNKN